jgi:hypothetical protein
LAVCDALVAVLHSRRNRSAPAKMNGQIECIAKEDATTGAYGFASPPLLDGVGRVCVLIPLLPVRHCQVSVGGFRCVGTDAIFVGSCLDVTEIG